MLAVSPAAGAPLLTRANYIPFVESVMSGARALPPARLSRHRIVMAGIAVDVAFGTGEIEPDYIARMGNPAPASDTPPDFTLYALRAADVGLDPLPQWGDPVLPAEAAETLMQRAGLLGENPSIPNVFRFFDPSSCTGVLLYRDLADLPPWHGGGPMVEFVRFALARHDMRVVHGATLGLDGRGLMLVGNGGAGKSGTTLAGLRSGLQSVGDDYVAVGFEAERPIARHLYRFMKQDRAGLDRHAGHPVARAPGEPNWHGKIEFDPVPYFPGCLVERLEIRAIVLPQISPDATTPQIASVSAAEAMRYAMRTNMFLGPIEDGLRFLGRLMRLPRYRIDLVADPLANGRALRELVETL